MTKQKLNPAVEAGADNLVKDQKKSRTDYYRVQKERKRLIPKCRKLLGKLAEALPKLEVHELLALRADNATAFADLYNLAATEQFASYYANLTDADQVRFLNALFARTYPDRVEFLVEEIRRNVRQANVKYSKMNEGLAIWNEKVRQAGLNANISLDAILLAMDALHCTNRETLEHTSVSTIRTALLAAEEKVYRLSRSYSWGSRRKVLLDSRGPSNPNTSVNPKEKKKIIAFMTRDGLLDERGQPTGLYNSLARRIRLKHKF